MLNQGSNTDSDLNSSKLVEEIKILLQQGNFAAASKEARKLSEEPDIQKQKVRIYFLLLNQKFPDVDSVCSKLLSRGMDHDLLLWRGVARAKLGLWYSSLEDLLLTHEFLPRENTRQHIAFTTREACKNISEGIRLDGGSYKDFHERSRVYLLAGDRIRSQRDLDSAEKLKPHAPELCQIRSYLYFAEGNLPKAFRQVDQYLEAFPDDLNGLLLKAKIRARTGRTRISLGLLNQLSEKRRGDEIGRLKIARCRHEIKDFVGSIEAYSAILIERPQSTSALMGRGQALISIRRFDHAIVDLQNAMQLDGLNAAALNLLAEAKLARGMTQQASSDVKAALKIEPENWRIRLAYAKLQFSCKENESALKTAEKLVQRFPHEHEIELFLGQLYFDKSDFSSAISHFAAATKKCGNPLEKSTCLYQLGTAKLENRMVNAAIADFERSLQHRPNHVGTLVWRGYAHAQSSQWAEAISDLQSAIDLNPLAAQEYKKLGDHIAHNALEHFANAIQSDNNHAESFFNRGMAHLFLGQNSQAENDFQKCLRCDPNHATAETRLGLLRLKKNEPKKAYSLFSVAMAKHTSPTVLLLRAEAMLQLGVTQPALKDIRRAMKSSRDDFRLYLRRGELYAHAGKSQKAYEDFTISIALNFDNYQAYKERARLLSAGGNLQDAIGDLDLSLHFNYRQPDLLIERGQLQLKLKNFELASIDFQNALRFDLATEQQRAAYIGKAKTLKQMGQAEKSLIWLTKAIHRFQQRGDWAELLLTRAGVFLDLGRIERAHADARTASKLNPDANFSAECYYIRALCSHFLGNQDHAIKSLEKALSRNNNHVNAELALDWFRQMAEQPPERWLNAPKKMSPKCPPSDSNDSPLKLDLQPYTTPPPMDLWLVKKGDQEFGPITLKTLVQWIQEGRIQKKTRLFRTDWGKWQKPERLVKKN